MGYTAVWEILEQLIADFRKRGKTIPPQIMNDLTSAKTMIQISRAEKEHLESIQKIEEYLTNVESYLVSEGEKQFGFRYIDKWLRRLEEANRISDATEGETRFIRGVSRKEKWVRIKPTEELPIEKLKALASESQLLCKLQEEGYLLVYGKDECLKDFVKKMATKYGLKRRK